MFDTVRRLEGPVKDRSGAARDEVLSFPVGPFGFSEKYGTND
jgi:hypothetical protein